MQHNDIEVINLHGLQTNGRRAPWSAIVDHDTEPQEKIKLLLHALLTVLGEDPNRDGLQRTPQRMARMYTELLSGYEVNVNAVLNGALFEVDYQEPVIVKDIQFYSLCEHHLLPFFGRAHVAYIPRKRVIGLSKIPRIVEMYARRLQVQERLTTQIADQLQAVLQPRGVAVVVEGTHLCMAMRGVRQQGAAMRTSVMRGAFQEDAGLRADFLQQLHVPANMGL